MSSSAVVEILLWNWIISGILLFAILNIKFIKLKPNDESDKIEKKWHTTEILKKV